MCEALTQAYNQAIRLLARREHSRKELTAKISRRQELSTSKLDQLLDDLEEAGYLDDRRFTEMFIRSSVSRGHGPMKITYALREKGIDNDMAREAFEVSDTDWLEQARFQREKKFGEEIPVDFKERARQSRFLAGRGFYIETINAVFYEKC